MLCCARACIRGGGNVFCVYMDVDRYVRMGGYVRVGVDIYVCICV